jgi:pimeloyl-ACP methyl ester carboxylesterase
MLTAAVMTGLLLLMDGCMQFRSTEKELKQHFAEHKVDYETHSYYHGRQKINYVQTGTDSLALVLFIHGSPGSLDAFFHFLVDSTLHPKAQLISVDRPGFGASNFGYAEPSLEKQAAQLKPILEKHRHQRPIVLVGHSLGGPLIARMAIDYPELVDGLIFVAGSVDPDLEPNEWFRAPLATPFLKWILPRSMRASNDEIYKLKPQLQRMVPLWSQITCPSIFIQGGKDELVPAGNADFARKMLVNAPFKAVIDSTMNHFVPWSHPQYIRDAVLELVSGKAITQR